MSRIFGVGAGCLEIGEHHVVEALHLDAPLVQEGGLLGLPRIQVGGPGKSVQLVIPELLATHDTRAGDLYFLEFFTLNA